MSASSTLPPARTRPAQLPHSMVMLGWIRKTHGWFGLWGAVLGLLFGTAGIWLNHRAVLKLPMAQERANFQLAVPASVPRTSPELALWLQQALQQREAAAVKVEPARRLAWVLPDGAAPLQPEHWTFTFGGPRDRVQAEYWKGNGSVAVTRTESGVAGTLANLHKGVGMSVGWILLVDSLAGSLIFLCVSGVALWLLTHRRRARAGLAILGSSVALTAGLIATRLLA